MEDNDIIYVEGKGKRVRDEQYQGYIARLFPELISKEDELNKKILTKTITFQVTDDCNLNCSYCYQTNKGKRHLKFESAKKLIDMLLDEDPKLNEYISLKNSPAIIIDFIGGEPFLEIDLIDKITDYFKIQTAIRKHPWALYHRFSICSNGVLYNDPKVQAYLLKNKDDLSFSITIDGNKELHDSCRLFHDGSPSYDIAFNAAKDWIDKGHDMGSKITIAPANVQYLYGAIIHMVESGYSLIHSNVVFEKGWELEHAKVYYEQLKKIADYWDEHDLYESTDLSLFDENSFCPKNDTDLDNWCGGAGLMLAIDPDGKLFPCLRYMESSLGDGVEPYSIGDVDNGIGNDKISCSRVDCLNCIDRRTQSTDECFNCPIADGCSWCTAYNYQELGTPNARVTHICTMHKARSLVNVYFWNNYYKKHNIDKVFKLWCPDEWALEIINKEELNMLKNL